MLQENARYEIFRQIPKKFLEAEPYKKDWKLVSVISGLWYCNHIFNISDLIINAIVFEAGGQFQTFNQYIWKTGILALSWNVPSP